MSPIENLVLRCAVAFPVPTWTLFGFENRQPGQPLTSQMLRRKKVRKASLLADLSPCVVVIREIATPISRQVRGDCRPNRPCRDVESTAVEGSGGWHADEKRRVELPDPPMQQPVHLPPPAARRALTW